MYYLAVLLAFGAFALSFLWYGLIVSHSPAYRIDWRRELPPLFCCCATGAWLLLLLF